MKIFIQLNDRGNAIRLYDDYKKMMRDELDLPPSPEMTAIYNGLTR
jgi:DNA-binding SARP family transcriptional activator